MKAFSSVFLAFTIWGAGSWAEVVTHHLNPQYIYNNCNMFKVMTEMKFGEEKPAEEPAKECLGVFEISAYCPCEICSEGYGRETATGTIAAAGRTIAVDPNVIPYGTHVFINGCEYVAEDCGGDINGNEIDMFFDTHAETLEWGVQSLNVYK